MNPPDQSRPPAAPGTPASLRQGPASMYDHPYVFDGGAGCGLTVMVQDANVVKCGGLKSNHQPAPPSVPIVIDDKLVGWLPVPEEPPHQRPEAPYVTGLPPMEQKDSHDQRMYRSVASSMQLAGHDITAAEVERIDQTALPPGLITDLERRLTAELAEARAQGRRVAEAWADDRDERISAAEAMAVTRERALDRAERAEAELARLTAEVERLKVALTRIASIHACDDHPPCGHMGLADDIAVQAVLGKPAPDHEPDLEPPLGQEETGHRG